MKLFHNVGNLGVNSRLFTKRNAQLDVFAHQINGETVVVVACFEHTVDVVLQEIGLAG